MEHVELATLRQAMLDRLTQIYREVHADMDATRVASLFDREPHDIGDDSVRDAEVDFTAGLDERDRTLAHRIQDALARMRDGSYGRCSDCDKPIPSARLALVPWAERCAADQAATEGPTHHSTL